MIEPDNINKPLNAEVDEGKLSIEIGISTLQFAFENGEENNPYDDNLCDTVRTYSICDAQQFAKDVCRAMNDEAEDGSTPLTRFLYSMMQEAINQGTMGINDPDGDL